MLRPRRGRGVALPFAQVGQCDKEVGSRTAGKGTYLFNLDADPTESTDLSTDPAYKTLVATMTAQITDLHASITTSAATESDCAVPGPAPSPGPSPSPPAPPSPPLPPTPPAGGFQLTYRSEAHCLTVDSLGPHPNVVIGACDGGSKWVTAGSGTELANVALPGLCLKTYLAIEPHGTSSCLLGARITVGKCTGDAAATYSFSAGEIRKGACHAKAENAVCLAPEASPGAAARWQSGLESPGVIGAGAVRAVLTSCNDPHDPAASGWAMKQL